MMHQIKPLNSKPRIGLKKNDESGGTYNVNSQIKFKTAMLKSSLVIIVMHISLLREK